LAAVDKFSLMGELKKFKNESGGINYPALFDIPKKERITEMAKLDLEGTVQVLSVSVKLAVESVNLKRPLTNNQIFDLVEAIIDEAPSDNLALEDLLLFLQKMTRGEYGELYESLDVPKIMHWFGKYRDERWAAAIKIRDEKHQEFKDLGDPDSYERSNRSSPIGEEMSRHMASLQRKKDENELLKKENQRLRNQRDF